MAAGAAWRLCHTLNLCLYHFFAFLEGLCVLFHRTTKLRVTTHVCTGTEVEQGRQKGFETQQPRYQAGAKGATCDLDEMVGRTGCPDMCPTFSFLSRGGVT